MDLLKAKYFIILAPVNIEEHFIIRQICAVLSYDYKTVLCTTYYCYYSMQWETNEPLLQEPGFDIAYFFSRALLPKNSKYKKNPSNQ